MDAPPAWANPNTPVPVAPAGTVGAGHAVPTAANVAAQQEHELFNTAYSTLDEPVRETIMRDVRAVADKLYIVIMPFDNKSMLVSPYAAVAASDTASVASDTSGDSAQQQQSSSTIGNIDLSAKDRERIQSLKDWDLWGPLVLCLTLAVSLSIKAPTNQSSLVFAAVFCIVWLGAAVVTLNAQLLGGTISFFQSVCVLGYSLFPLTIAALVIMILRLVSIHWLWLDAILVVPAYFWSIRVSSLFIGIYIRQERRFLALYPVFFYNIFLAWLILLF